MQVQEMTKAARFHLSKIKKCSICHQYIEYYDDVQIIKYQKGRFMEYHFFHTSCLARARDEIRNQNRG